MPMKILSYNVRGLGGILKKKEIKELISKLPTDVVCLQEIKVCDHTLLNENALWGILNVGWKARNSDSRSRGIWISWRIYKFKLLDH